MKTPPHPNLLPKGEKGHGTHSTLVIGIGNEFRHDDVIGLLLLRALQQESLPTVQFVESSGDPAELLDLWQGQERVLLLDAIVAQGQPGRLHRYPAHDKTLPSTLWPASSTHAIGVMEAIELARSLRELPQELIVYGIEAACFDYGKGLSPELEESLAENAAIIIKDLL